MDSPHEVEFDHHTQQFVDDPYSVYAHLHQQCAVAHTESYDGFWLLSQYADVRGALMDWETFSSGEPGTLAIPSTLREDKAPLLPLESDPPAHTHYRSAVIRMFARKEVDAIEAEVRKLANKIIDRFIAAGECDLVADYAEPLFSYTLAIFLKLPLEDTKLWAAWANAIFAGRVKDPEGALRARRKLAAYAEGLLEERRQNPRDDIFTAILDLRIDDKPLTQDEIRGFALEILLAGREATIDGLCNSLWYLAERPEARQRLIDEPKLMRLAVEEFLRYMSPIQLLGRKATRDVTIHGQDIHEGESVAMMYGAGNRDETQFENAGQCILDRSPNPHLAFGAGPHSCIGAHLARLGMRVGIGEFLARIPDFQLSEAQSPQRKLNGDARGFIHLPITFSIEQE